MFPNINQDYLLMLINKAINISFERICEQVIKKVIPITLITTREMILKDFALDPDAEKLKIASRNTSKGLSGMLAQITCKEPLKRHLTKSLKDLIANSENPSINFLSDIEKRNIIESLRNENLEIGCRKIRQYIQKEAMTEILKDNSILEAIKQREIASTQRKEYRDYSNLSNFNRLPDLLKPSENGLTKDELQVYSDFDTNIQNYDMESQIINNVEMILEDESEKQTDAQLENNIEKIICNKFVKLCYAYISTNLKIDEINIITKKELVELQCMINQVSNCKDVLVEELLRQRKQISLNPLLIVFLIEQKVISLLSWQKKFSVDLLKLPGSVDSVEIIEFLEIFIINGFLDKKVLSKANMPELISLIEILSKSEGNQLAFQWKLILDLFELSDPFSHILEEITDVYLDQWFNSSDITAISNKLLYKIKIVFKNSK